MNVAGGDLNWISTLNDSQFQQSLRRMDTEVNRTTQSIQNQGNQLESYARRATQAVSAFFSIQAATGFVSQLTRVRSEFQQLDIAFSTMLKSKSGADKLMKELVVFAGTTPFGLKDAAGAAKQLLAYGSTAKNVVSELRMLGDVASGVSAPINDLVYLYGTLKTQGRAYAMDIRQFAGRGIPIYAELAKVLGVSKDKVTDLVSAGKVGFAEVEQAFKNMTSAGGMFGGLMEAQSATLTGQIERLSDAWDLMLNKIGTQSESVIGGAIALASDLVANYETVATVLTAVIATYGVYRAAILLTAVAQKTFVLTETIAQGYKMVQVTRAMTAAEALRTAGNIVAARAQAALNVVMMANPYAIAAAAIVALGIAMYALNDNITAQEKAMSQLNTENENAAKNADDLKNKVSSLNAVLQDKNATDFQQSKAFAELQSLYPQLFGNLTKEAYLKIAAADAQKQINAANDQNSISDLGKRFIDAQNRVVGLTNDIKRYQDIISKAGDQGGSLTKTIEGIKNEIEIANIKASELGKEFNKQQEDLKVSLMSEKEKITYYERQKSELIKQKEAMIQLNRYSGDLQSIFNSYNLTNLENQLNAITNKILSFKEKPIEVRTISVIDAEIQSKKDDQKNKSTRAEYEALEKEIKKLEAEKSKITGVQVVDKVANTELSKVKRYSEMLKKIYEVNEKYNTKSLTDDEQKFADIRNEYKSLQKDIDQYNKDPKNKKVNPNLKPALEKAIENQQYQNDTEKLKIELDKQKQLYDDYEDYKSVLGKESTDDRFKNELNTSVTYLQKLEAERAKLLDKDPTNMTGPELERLRYIDKRINEEVKAEQKKYDELVKSLISYEQDRRLLTENYNRDIDELTARGLDDEKVQATKLYREKLNILDDSHIKELDSYKALYEGIDSLSDDNARKVISKTRVMLAEQISSGKISKELAKELEKLIKDSERSISQRLPDNLINIANQIDGIANAVGNVDEGFGKVVGTLGNVLGQVGNIKKGMDSFKEAGSKGNVLGQLGAGLGIVGTGISIFKTVFSLFDRSQQREEQAAYSRELQNKQTESLNKALERQIALLNDAYGTDRLVKYNEAIKQATENEAKYQDQLKGRYQLTGDKALDKYLEKLNSGEMKLGGDPVSLRIKSIINSGGIKTLSSDLSELQRLLDEGKLDANTSVIVQNLIKASEAAKQLKNQLNAENVGSSLSQIADEFIKTLTDGTQDFGKSFEDTIRMSILNGFKSKLIEQQLQAFYNQFAELSSGGLTKEEIATLRDSYTKAAEKSKKAIEDLEKATGIKLGGDNKTPEALKPNTLTASLNQQTGERLEGLWRGQFDLTKQMNLSAIQILNIAKSNFDTALKIEANTFRTANNTDRLANIESALASIDKKTGAKTTRD